MLFSTQEMFSESQVITTTQPSANVIDLGVPGSTLGSPAQLRRDIGRGRAIRILVQLAAVAGGTSPTLVVALQVDDNEGFATPSVVASAPQKAGGAIGDRIKLWMPEGTDERYMRLLYTLGGTDPTYTLIAGIVAADQTAA